MEQEKYMRGPTKHEHENRVVFRNADRRAVGRGDPNVPGSEADADSGFADATRMDLE